MAGERMAARARRQPNDRLRAKRVERGQTQEELAGELSQLRWQEDANAPALTAGMVSRWERGQRPRPHHRRLLVEHFGSGADDLGLRLPHLVAGDGAAVVRPRYAGDTKRRTFLVGAAGTVAGLAGTVTADPLLAAMSRLNRLAGASIGAAVDGYEALIADLGTSYSAEPVGRLYARLDGLLSTIEGIIEAGPPGPYLRRLQSVAGWCAGLLGNALHDIGDPAAARMNVSLGLEYGRLAGDARLLAYLRDRQVLFAVDAGRWDEALDLARAGLQVAPAATAIAMRLRSSEARQLARLGRRDEALAALQALQAEYEALPAAEIGEGSFAVSTAFREGASGNVYGNLGELAAAESDLRQVIGYYVTATGPGRRPTRLACHRLTLALVLARAGRPDEAATVAGEALTTDRLVADVVRRAGQVDAALSERWPELAETRMYRDRYLALEAGGPEPTSA